MTLKLPASYHWSSKNPPRWCTFLGFYSFGRLTYPKQLTVLAKYLISSLVVKSRILELLTLCFSGLAKSLARCRGAIVFSSRLLKCITALLDGLSEIQGSHGSLNLIQLNWRVFKALKSFKYVKCYKKSLNYNFKRSYSWEWKGKNRNMAGFNFKRQLCNLINMSDARFEVKTGCVGCLHVNGSLKGADYPQKCIVGIFI